jgi:hypothetical protein
MPDSIKDRPGDITPSLAGGFSASIVTGGTGAGLGDGSTSPLRRTNLNQPSPLSITLPSRGSGYGNSVAPFSPGPHSAGYLEERRDTFHGLSHPSSSSTSYQYLNNSNTYSNTTTFLQDDSQPPLSLHHRPQSLSYANLHHPLRQSQQQLASPTSIGPDSTIRRRRLSTASSSSKQRHGSSSNLRPKAHNTPHHTRRFTTLISDQEPDTTYLWGYLLFFSTMIGFTGSMYALVASNYMPMTGNKVHYACQSFLSILFIPIEKLT